MNKLEDLNSEKKNIHGKGAIYFICLLIRFLVLKDLTVDPLRNAFGEHVLKEEIHKYRKLSYPYLQSNSVIRPFCLQYQHNSAF